MERVRGFEFARKIENGEVVYVSSNTENGDDVKVSARAYDIDDSYLPVYGTLKAACADFRAAEDTVVKSIWSAIFAKIGAESKLLVNKFTDFVNGNKNSESTMKAKELAQKSFEPTLVHTGIKAYMQDDEVLHIYNRSSGPKRGLVLSNSVGLIDADYYNNVSNDGEIMFSYYNFFPFDITIKKGERIGQGEFSKFLQADNPVYIATDTRGGGFGSTGKD